MSDKNHPIWALLRTVVIMGGITGILAVTANKFDESEIKTILLSLPVVLGVESAGLFGKKKEN